MDWEALKRSLAAPAAGLRALRVVGALRRRARVLKSWLAFSGVLALSVFEAFLVAWVGQAIAERMLEEIGKHPEITAVWSAAANALAAALVVAIIAPLAWGAYETAVDAVRFKRA